MSGGGQCTSTQDEAPLDLSAKAPPLRIQTQSRHVNKPSSPIVISPTASDEPMNLCVKKNVNNLTQTPATVLATQGQSKSVINSQQRFSPFALNNRNVASGLNPAQQLSVIQTPPTVINTSPLVSLSQTALTQSPLSVLQSPPSVIQANPSLLQTGGSIIQTNLPVLPTVTGTAISPSAGSVLPSPAMVGASIAGATALQQQLQLQRGVTPASLATSVLNSGSTVLQSGGSVLQQSGGSLLQASTAPGTNLLQSGGSLIQTPAGSVANVIQTTPVISLSSVIKPPGSVAGAANEATRTQNSKV